MSESLPKILDFTALRFFFRPYTRQSVVLLFLIGIAGFFETLNLAALYPVINYGLDLNNQNFVLSYFNKLINILALENSFYSSCLILIVVSFFSISIKFFYGYYSYSLSTRIMGDMQRTILGQLVQADYYFYVKNQQGKLIHTSTIAPSGASAVVVYSIKLVHDAVQCLFLFGLLLMLSWQATFFLLCVGLIYAVFVKNINEKVIYRCSSQMVEEDRKKNVILNELITGIQSIKVFNTFSEWSVRYLQAVQQSLRNQFWMMMGKIFPESFIKLLFYLIIAVAGIYLSQKPAGQVMAALPVFGTFAVVASRFFPSIQMLGHSFMTLSDHAPNTKIVYDICTQEVQKIPDGNLEMTGFQDQLRFEQVWFRYESAVEPVLRNVSFSIPKRKMTALVGPSGAGKTTVVNLMLRLYLPDQGQILIDGVNIFDYTKSSYLARIGFVGQDVFLYHASIRENIRFGLDSCTDAEIEETARLAHAHEFIIETQHGYDTIVGDFGIKLSGGQQQRIAIARAMLRKPEIIVFDEATSSLDNISERKIQEAISNISKHTTVLVIAHRLSTIRHADNIVIFERGEVVEQGSHNVLMENRNLYYQLQMAKDVYV